MTDLTNKEIEILIDVMVTLSKAFKRVNDFERMNQRNIIVNKLISLRKSGIKC